MHQPRVDQLMQQLKNEGIDKVKKDIASGVYGDVEQDFLNSLIKIEEEKLKKKRYINSLVIKGIRILIYLLIGIIGIFIIYKNL